MTIYEERGFKSRREYLTGLAEEYGLDPSDVFAAAWMLGADEDFDGLVTFCQDREMAQY